MYSLRWWCYDGKRRKNWTDGCGKETGAGRSKRGLGNTSVQNEIDGWIRKTAKVELLEVTSEGGKQVNTFFYLGTVLTVNPNIENEIQNLCVRSKPFNKKQVNIKINKYVCNSAETYNDFCKWSMDFGKEKWFERKKKESALVDSGKEEQITN